MQEQHKLSKYFTYKPLNKYEGLYGTLPCRAPTTYIGIELEFEQVKYKRNGTLPTSFRQIEDGSLKMNGKEFVTRPIRFCYLEQELKRLFSSLETPLMSERCSIHIHMNARDFTMEELSKFIILYCIFEKSLFHYANKKTNRWSNIFCTPLYFYPGQITHMLKVCKQNLSNSMQWFKYFAMNLSPIFGGESKQILGTIEFRHMEATNDVEYIINWVNLLVSLKIAAKKIELPVLLELVETMNTTSYYVDLARTIFGNWSNLIVHQPSFQEDVETCIALTKSVLLQADYIKQQGKCLEELSNFEYKGTKACVA